MFYDQNYERAKKIVYTIGGVDFTEYMDKLCTVFLRAERMYGEVSVHIEYLP